MARIRLEIPPASPEHLQESLANLRREAAQEPSPAKARFLESVADLGEETLRVERVSVERRRAR